MTSDLWMGRRVMVSDGACIVGPRTGARLQGAGAAVELIVAHASFEDGLRQTIDAYKRTRLQPVAGG